MKRGLLMPMLSLAVAACLLLVSGLPLHATNLTGTFKNPDGSPVNGKLIFLLSQPARLNDSSAQVVPLVKIFSVNNGVLEAGAFLYGNDVLVPAGTYYLVRLVDNNNNLLFEQKWQITGTNLDLGTLTPTTVGVVLADPLVKNTSTEQAVQGPVTFGSSLTAFSLTLHGDLNPGTPGVFNLGSPSNPWRELNVQELHAKGPNPWVDVKAFGAVGDGTTDDTTAITNAIAYACQKGGYVFFPPHAGSSTGYVITSTINLYTIMSTKGCSSMHLRGGSANFSGNMQYGGATQILNKVPNGPVFLYDGLDSRRLTFENLILSSHLDATKGFEGMKLAPADSIRMFNVAIGVQYSAARTDAANYALNIQGSLWNQLDNCVFAILGNGTNLRPSLRFSNGMGVGVPPALVFMRDTRFVGGAIHVHAEQSPIGGAAAGTWDLEDITGENVAGPMLLVSKESAVNPINIQVLRLKNIVHADAAVASPVIRVTADNAVITSMSCFNCSAAYPSIVELLGANNQVFGAIFEGYAGSGDALPIVDPQGRPVGEYTSFNKGTFRRWVRSVSANPNNRANTEHIGTEGPAIQLGREQEFNSKLFLDVDSSGGYLRSNGPGGDSRGWDTGIEFTNNREITIAVAETIPPAFTSATPTTGGTLPNGTYYYRMEVTTGVGTTTPGPIISATLSGGNNAVALAWNAVANATSYRIWRGTAHWLKEAGVPGVYFDVAAPATSFTDTGSAGTSGTFQAKNTTYTARHRITRTSFGMNRQNNAAVFDGLVTSTSQKGLVLETPASYATNVIDVVDSASQPWFQVQTNLLRTKLTTWRISPDGSTNHDILFPGAGASRQWTLPALTGTFALLENSQTFSGTKTFTAAPAFNPASGAPFTTTRTDLVTNLNADLLDSMNSATAATASTIAARDASGDLTARVLISSVSTGTAPLTVSSTTAVANLNADKWDGKDGIDFSATLDFGSIAAQTCAELTITAPGVAADNPVAASWPASLPAGLVGMMRVSAADTVTVRLCNVTASAADPASATFAGRAIK